MCTACADPSAEVHSRYAVSRLPWVLSAVFNREETLALVGIAGTVLRVRLPASPAQLLAYAVLDSPGMWQLSGRAIVRRLADVSGQFGGLGLTANDGPDRVERTRISNTPLPRLWDQVSRYQRGVFAWEGLYE